MLIEHLRVHNVRYELMKFEGLGVSQVPAVGARPN